MTGTVLITGAAARIGRTLAIGLAKDGWDVAIHYHRSEDKADNLAMEIADFGAKAITVQANLAVPSDIDALIPTAAKSLGRPLTALINNASAFKRDNAQSFTQSGFDDHMHVNLYAPLRLSQNFAAQAPNSSQSNIINLIDQRVLKPNPTFFTYSLSKAGLHWATKTMAQAFAPKIRVNGIGPGPTLANIHQKHGEFDAEAQATLLGYGSPPDAHLEAVRYLLGATSVTGQMIAVDSGQHLNWQTQDLITGSTE